MLDATAATEYPDVEAINWNEPADPKDVEVFDRLVKNFWVPEKIPMSGDLPSWATLTAEEQETTEQAFAGLTLLDTLQSSHGAKMLIDDAVTQQEEAVYANIIFMEAIHAKSYSNIFTTLCSTERIREIFRWARENEFLQKKKNIVLSRYYGSDPFKRKIASVLLESFLFYSGFFLPLYWDSRQKLPNTANMIKLIIRDEAVHGYYIGYKYQTQVANLSAERQQELKDFTYELLMELYDNEVLYTQSLYDKIGLTEQVKKFLHYNANKALMNLGYDALFPASVCDVNPSILAALGPEGAVNHDFFSVQGSTYKMAEVAPTTDDDWKVTVDEDEEEEM